MHGNIDPSQHGCGRGEKRSRWLVFLVLAMIVAGGGAGVVWWAIESQSGDRMMVKWAKEKGLKERGADVDARDEDGQTPMFRAATWSQLGVMTWLVEQGADINARDDEGQTPMHAAARNSQIAGMKWLRERGADVNAKDNDGQTPLSVAIYSEEARQWLRANGARK